MDVYQSSLPREDSLIKNFTTNKNEDWHFNSNKYACQ